MVLIGSVTVVTCHQLTRLFLTHICKAERYVRLTPIGIADAHKSLSRLVTTTSNDDCLLTKAQVVFLDFLNSYLSHPRQTDRQTSGAYVINMWCLC